MKFQIHRKNPSTVEDSITGPLSIKYPFLNPGESRDRTNVDATKLKLWGHSSKLREISFMRLTIEKKYFFNKINLYVLEQCAFMAIISFYSLKIIFGHFTRCNWTCLLSMVFVGFFGGKWYKNGLFEATTHKYIGFTALNAGIR